MPSQSDPPHMSQDAVADLVDLYLNDLAFRDAFVRDPEAAVVAAGFALTEAELDALRASISPHTDQPLKPRVTKYSFGS
jgi:hypothetical protein